MTLPPTYGYTEETHYISDETFKIINETLSPYDEKSEVELKDLEDTIKKKIQEKEEEKDNNKYVLIREKQELQDVISKESIPNRVAVEEAKVYLTELKISLNDAEITTFGTMLHYINEKIDSDDITRVMQPNIELIHIFVIEEYIIKDKIAMAKSNFDIV